jgi:hypothetical protein
MIFVPLWITNFILLGTCWLSGYQLVQLRRANPIPTVQFMMILFCLLVVLVGAIESKGKPWLSVVLLVIAIVNLVVMLRQHRLLPPRNPLR